MNQNANSPDSYNLEYLNPTYDAGDNLSPPSQGSGDNASVALTTNESEAGLDLFDIKAFEEMEIALKEIDEKKQNKELKIETLDRQKKGSNRTNMWRFGPAPIEDGLSEIDTVKLGSLQGERVNEITITITIFHQREPLNPFETFTTR